MKNKPTVTIGIPAHNEEANIKNLLESIFGQNMVNFKLEKVYVLCDGCTDNTARVSRLFSKDYDKVVVTDDGKRLGKPRRLNTLYEIAKGDYIVSLDADVVLNGPRVLENLIKPLTKDKKVGLVWGRSVPTKPRNLVSKSAYFGVKSFEDAIDRLGKRGLAYRAVGRIRAVPKEFARNFHFPKNAGSGEDAYQHYFAIINGWKVSYQSKAVVSYQLVNSVADYIRQMRRFISTSRLYEGNINRKLGKKEFKQITWASKLRYLLKRRAVTPLRVVFFYVLLQFVSHIAALSYKKGSPVWNVASSTKIPSTLRKVEDKPRIIISSYDDLKNPLYSGGGAYAIHKVAQKITKDFDVRVITGNYPESYDQEVDGVSYKRIGVSSLNGRIGQLIFHFLLPFYATKEKYDLWVESFTPPHSVSMIPLFTKKPVIGWAHMLAGEDMKRKYKLPFHLIENLGLKFYNHFVVLNQKDLLKIKKTNKDAEVELIPNGVVQPKIKAWKKRNQILFIGRIEIDQKGLDILIKAFKQVLKVKSVKLVIAGSGPANEEVELRRLIKRQNVQKKVELVGRVDEQKRNSLYKKSLLVVVPSRYESFSLVCLEAASFQLPVVCFDIPGLKWLPPDSARKIKRISAEEFSDAILSLLRDKKKRNDIGARANVVSKRYSWDKTAELFGKFLNRVTQRKLNGNTQFNVKPKMPLTNLIKADHRKLTTKWEVSKTSKTLSTK